MKLAPLLFVVLLAIVTPSSAQTGQDAVVAELLDRDFGTLEKSLAAVQDGFERGELTEYELRRAFEPFARLRNARARDLLREWVARSPDSVLHAEHDASGADALFRQALQLARRSGDKGGFRIAYLAASIKHVCQEAPDAPACGRAIPAASAVSPATASTGVSLGTDIEHPVVILREDHAEGVRTEYAWLALRDPGARPTSQALLVEAARHYDLLEVTTSDGRSLELYFDVTASYDRSAKPAAK